MSDVAMPALRRPSATPRHAVLTLFARIHDHDGLGRVYLPASGPFHRGVVESGLRRAVRREWPRPDGDPA